MRLKSFRNLVAFGAERLTLSSLARTLVSTYPHILPVFRTDYDWSP